MRVAFACLLLIPAIAFAAPVPKATKKKLPDFYPLTEGTTWEYEMGKTPVTVRVKEFQEKDGVRTGKLVTEHEGKAVASESIRVDAEGVARTHINESEIKPGVVILKFGLGDEESWEVKSKTGTSEVAGKFTLKGTEKVKVPAGEFEVVVVKGEMTVAGTEATVTYWLAEGVGVVKLMYAIGGVNNSALELKKYTPGKAEKK